MASQQAYNAHAQNKGTLIPGQSISVNKFTVQVERYLSQGGFAHVYLVRTATPVYNTTHHVLKRIAVANEAMLTEVKKEVDIMRLLKGHPNIVHLIDAAWHKMANGVYEVFILMEFCPGGGIIDMMNRRLRERLTEAEILQIFVDVCEGVACMHNLRPALLHRDLKVENILQSSSTSYKLCDFGSATAVARPPQTTQEIRALEADLNRHTTLQYRAPEMVDVYSRRPVDEKSDVWALGVLLYKLCYYTTPFEEHGQLAILNVQYRIPPYPVYSPQMNQLIASMLREHGSQRPSVFELLSHVHRLRGTNSRFKYTIPVPQPLSPRQQTQFKPPASPNHIEHMVVPSNKVPMSVSPSRGQGIQAREKVMEAIAPMRRGEQTFTPEPTSLSDVPNTQPMRRGRPAKEVDVTSRPTTSHKTSDVQAARPSGTGNWLDDGFVGTVDTRKSATANDARTPNGSADVWNIDGKALTTDVKGKNLGFGDDFAEKLWDAVGGSKPEQQAQAKLTDSSKYTSPTRHPLPASSSLRASPDKDAFEGLGLGPSSQKLAPTLAEARKLRTGLATMHTSGFQTKTDKQGSSAFRPSSSPRSGPSALQLYPTSVNSSSSNVLNPSPSRLGPKAPSDNGSPAQVDGLPIESRFPSLEELDASFSPGVPSIPRATFMPQATQEKTSPLARRNGAPTRSSVTDAGLLKPDLIPRGSHTREGTRSEQVTGIAMREPRGSSDHRVPMDSLSSEDKKAIGETHPRDENDPSSRPMLTRKHRSSVTMKHAPQPSSSEQSSTSSALSSRVAQETAPRLPARRQPKDWLTGDDDHSYGSATSLPASTPPGETAILRDSPSKRASVIQRSTVPIHLPVVPQHDHVHNSRRSPSPSPAPEKRSPTVSRFTRAFPPIELPEDRGEESGHIKQNSVSIRASKPTKEPDSGSSGEDEGPEDAGGIVRPVPKALPQRRTHKGRQSSVHDLVDLYGGGLGAKEKERDTRPPAFYAEPSQQRLKGRITGTTPLNSATSNPSPASASSQTLLSPLNIGASSRQTTASDQRNGPPSSGPTPSPSRSRPQSMFIFPSKSTDSSLDQWPTTPNLLPPEDPKLRAVRRTSISDIVQRYEGIGGGAKPGLPLSPAASRPAGRAVPSNEGRYVRGQYNDKERASLTAGEVVDSGRPLRSPIESNRISPVPKISTPIPIPHSTTLRKEPEDIVVRARKTSLKPEPIRPRFLSRKTTDDSSALPEGGSSPEKPYQGVGKLIDQWQRKTAEAEPPRGALRDRGTSLAKRP